MHKNIQHLHTLTITHATSKKRNYKMTYVCKYLFCEEIHKKIVQKKCEIHKEKESAIQIF